VAQPGKIIALYDERFLPECGLFYLAGATRRFENGGIVNYQIQFSRIGGLYR